MLLTSLLATSLFISLDTWSSTPAHAVSAASVSVTLDRTSGPKAGMTRVKFEGEGMRNVQTIHHDGNAISFTRVTATNYAVLLPDVTGQGVTQPVLRLIYQNGTSVDLDRGTYTYTNNPKVIDTLTADRTQVLPGERPTISTTLPSGYQMARWLDFSPQSGIATSSPGVAMATWTEIMSCSDTQDKTLEIRSYDSFYNAGFVQPAKLDNGNPADASATNERFASQIFITYKAAPQSQYCLPPASSGSNGQVTDSSKTATTARKDSFLRLPGFAGYSASVTSPQLEKLKNFLAKNPGFKNLELTGITSSDKTTNSLKFLARSRTKSIWSVVSKIAPDSTLVKIRTKTDLGIDPKNRAVRIRLIF